jgi:O-succinylbenzoate synthase
MRIDRIDLYHVAMPLKAPWRTAYGEDAAIEAVLCRLTSGSLVGWGEAAPFAAPCYSPEWAGGVFAVAREWLGPALLGADIASGTELQRRLAVFKGNPFAKAAFDTAWWSLEAQRTGKSLAELLGGTRRQVAVGADFGVMDSLDDLLAAIDGAVRDRFRRIKLKFRPGWDREMLSAVRRAFPHITLHIDCNSGYTLRDLPLFQWVDQQHLAMIEQPLRHDDLSDHALLQQVLATPVCLDESITSVAAARTAIRWGSCRFVNIKPGRVGGLTVAREIHDVCRAAGIPCWVGGMLESATGAQHCLALATLENCTYPADLFPSERFYVEDLSDPPLVLSRDPEGCPAMDVLQRLAEPVPARLERCTRQSVVLRR